MVEIKEEERKAKWHYPPSFIKDDHAWMSACNEVAQSIGEEEPFRKNSSAA
jgi:hypothetical protein